MNTDKQPQTVYTEQQIIEIIDEILEHSDCVMDAITNENTNFDGAELFNTVKNYIPKTKPSYIFAPEELEALLQKERREAAEKAFQAGEKHGSDCAYNSIGNSSIDHPPAFIWLEENYPLPQPPKKNIMKRNNGYYWVFYVNHWEIAEWNGEYFYLPGDELGHEAEEFEKIYETQITRNEEYNNKNKYCNH